MTGAVSLAGMAALRSGAGLISLAVPANSLPIVAAHDPAYMTVPLHENRKKAGQLGLAALPRIEQLAADCDCVAYGPGVGQSPQLDELAIRLYRTLPLPMVVDADGLNALSRRRQMLSMHAGPRVLTPHPGEFRRLVDDERLPADQWQPLAEQLARENEIVVVLKGHRTLITDGEESFHNTTGNSGMATGGSGDVLTGVICALVCQGMAPRDAAQLGVHLHGLAGDMAADELGAFGMTASDIVRYLSKAFAATM